MHLWWNGRHAGFRFQFRKECGFKSHQVQTHVRSEDANGLQTSSAADMVYTDMVGSVTAGKRELAGTLRGLLV